MYGYLADAVVFFHVLYVAYVVLGQLVVMVAGTARWAWGRNPWFRFTHLAAIGFVAFEEFIGMRCPLTVWEEKLRLLAGQSVHEGTFLGRFLHDMLFIDGTFSSQSIAVMHVACAILVVQAALMYPPRWFRTGTTNEGRHSAVSMQPAV
ncbi:DUF2784 domain-containing protein [Fimbriiglobus ruber]|uniref:Putative TRANSMEMBRANE PROTEIN n=1 Tax=Fimbriiglobus ruber TaxID=1908690 RepID=A0A225DAS7_9BACT|nr:DUF2784 domain-containing protein [Fimbriiglobus ruber]OWK35648.1 putative TRANSMEMBRANE PROTEIN [Fimbriiglobus ruber]